MLNIFKKKAKQKSVDELKKEYMVRPRLGSKESVRFYIVEPHESHESKDPLIAIEELEAQLLNSYNAISTYQNGRFINMSANDTEGYNELKQNFPLHEDHVREYVLLIRKLTMEDRMFKHIPLPPFIVFPMYSPTTIGWRMGAGEEYADCFYKSIKKLSQKEILNYCKNFNYPQWWMNKDFPSRYQNMPWKNRVSI